MKKILKTLKQIKKEFPSTTDEEGFILFENEKIMDIAPRMIENFGKEIEVDPKTTYMGNYVEMELTFIYDKRFFVETEEIGWR